METISSQSVKKVETSKDKTQKDDNFVQLRFPINFQYKNKFTLIAILIFIAFGAFMLSVFLSPYFTKIVNRSVTQNKPTPLEKNVNESQSVNPLIGQQVFTDNVPNFSNLKIDDLPSFIDLRAAYQYGNQLILVGYGRIVFYDPQTNSFLKQNQLLRCTFTAALFGNNLYVGCNGEMISQNKEVTFEPSTIYKIDLTSGKIMNIYFGPSQNDHKLVNIKLAKNGNYIWGSSDDENFRFDPESETFNFYSTRDSNFPQIDTNFPQIDNKVKDQGSLSVPKFCGITNLINGKYYLISNVGVYTLASNEFPKFFKNIKAIYPCLQGNRFYINKEESYILQIGWYGGEVTTDADFMPIVLIDLNRGEAVNLMSLNMNINSYHKLNNDQNIKLADSFFDKLVFDETNAGIIIKNSATGEVLMTITYLTKEISFFP
jgi:hypothetical protein